MINDCADLLREHGVQVTAQRLAVLRAATGRPHSSAEQIAEAVRADIGAISHQAVYDALSLLTEKRLLRRVHLAGAAAIYERELGNGHHHLICRACGGTIDVDCDVDEAFCLSAAADSGHRIDRAEVVFWGTCRECLAKGTETGVREITRKEV